MSAPESGKRPAPEKSERAFRTISEVSEELGVPQHVLRFWETRFTQVRPIKRNGGRRLYRPDHVALLRGIRALLYDDALTIKGVQKVLRERGQRAVIARGAGDAGLGIQAAGGEASERLAAIRDRLEAGEAAGERSPEPPAAEQGEGAAPDAPAAQREAVAGTVPVSTTEDTRPGGKGAAMPEDARARIRTSIARLEDILSRLEG